jgi:dephospho-CoA kinase
MFVGLTGGIGSGKSTVADMFEKLGARIIYADELAREAIAPGTSGFEAVVARFGQEIIQEDGRIDRKLLAAMVFGQPENMAHLEEIIHPRVAAALSALRQAIDPDKVVIYEIPLLVELDMAERFDKVIVVLAPAVDRIVRLKTRGLDDEDILERMGQQASDEERLRVANYVIDNAGNREFLEKQVEFVWSELRRANTEVS